MDRIGWLTSEDLCVGDTQESFRNGHCFRVTQPIQPIGPNGVVAIVGIVEGHWTRTCSYPSGGTDIAAVVAVVCVTLYRFTDVWDDSKGCMGHFVPPIDASLFVSLLFVCVSFIAFAFAFASCCGFLALSVSQNHRVVGNRWDVCSE